MLGVLIVHSDFGAIGVPSHQELVDSPLSCILRIFTEGFAIVSVNVFVLISGWFGIRFSFKGLCNLLFQCFFWFFGIYFTLVFLGFEPFSLHSLSKCLMLTDNAWFVKCYLGLFIFSPVLNAYCDNVDKKTSQKVLVCFFVFQSIYGWYSQGAEYIKMGYSAWSFCGLYLLARYVRIHNPIFSQLSLNNNMLLYLSFSILTSFGLIISLFANKHNSFAMLWGYSSPLVIFAALFLLLAFSKMEFISTKVNWVASSCFAVYLQHFIIFHNFMSPTIRTIWAEYSGCLMLLLVAGLLLLFSSTAIVIDKIRMVVWNRFLSPFFYN